MVPERSREQARETARSIVRRVVAMILSHYPGLERVPMSGGWASGNEDDEYDELEAKEAGFTDTLAALAMAELGL